MEGRSASPSGKPLSLHLKQLKKRLGIGISEGKMSLISHLAEFRKRLIVSASCFIVAMLLCLMRVEWFADQLIGKADGFNFIYIAPAELFVSYLRLAMIGGIVIAIPVIIYQVWRFIRPGLHEKERKGGMVVLTFGMLLFFIGAAFAFQIVLPLTLRFFAGLNTGQSILPMVSIESYISFVVSMLLTFGIMFELPIVTILLTQIGILNPMFLRKKRKYIILIIFVVAAIITPPDVTSQVLVAIPMALLLELSIFISSILFRKKLKAAKEEEDAA